MRHLRIGAFSFALVLGGLACTPLTPPRSRVAVPLHAITSDEILHTVDLRWHSVQDVRALARISVRSAKGRYSARETFLWSRPATLRLETLNVAGQPFMALVADPEGVSIYYPHEGVFFQGPSSATNLARFIGLPLDVEEWRICSPAILNRDPDIPGRGPTTSRIRASTCSAFCVRGGTCSRMYGWSRSACSPRASSATTAKGHQRSMSRMPIFGP